MLHFVKIFKIMAIDHFKFFDHHVHSSHMILIIANISVYYENLVLVTRRSGRGRIIDSLGSWRTDFFDVRISQPLQELDHEASLHSAISVTAVALSML